MKRFIDLGYQLDINDEIKSFAFYCTIIDRFEVFNNCCVWEDVNDFIEDMEIDNEPKDQIIRRINLIPSSLRGKIKCQS